MESEENSASGERGQNSISKWQNNKSLYQVLGAIAYGELKAYEGAKELADLTVDRDASATYKKFAAQELRHHKGFVKRLAALGADPERAMKPFVDSLNQYHAKEGGNEIQNAVWSFLGEGIASDLLRWLKEVVDTDTADFIDTVLKDESQHEKYAEEKLRQLIDRSLISKLRAAIAAREMLFRMTSAGGVKSASFLAFLRLGQAHKLVAYLSTGYLKRLNNLGLTIYGNTAKKISSLKAA
ncbi:MAG: long-chain fatty aldehyde decarbonylase [Acidimicrobiales bacterium]|nr:long-chain fatty aldehyde decarbonylase [Acidimicrobiales bacterium]